MPSWINEFAFGRKQGTCDVTPNTICAKTMLLYSRAVTKSRNDFREGCRSTNFLVPSPFTFLLTPKTHDDDASIDEPVKGRSCTQQNDGRFVVVP